MIVDWVEVRRGNVLTCTATIHGYKLMIIGKEGVWLWFIDRYGHAATYGTGNRLVSVKATVEATVALMGIVSGQRDADGRC